jgi:hypothetical protein
MTRQRDKSKKAETNLLNTIKEQSSLSNTQKYIITTMQDNIDNLESKISRNQEYSNDVYNKYN